MGSGGLRGLQILLSGVSGVRGGFDSHAFPPLVAAIVAACCALASPAAAALPGAPVPAPPISAFSLLGPVAVVEDTVLNDVLPRAPLPGTTEPAPPDTGVARIVDLPRNAPNRVRTPQSDPRLRPTFEQPRWVMMRSLVVPGWGQFHNKAWLKGLAIAGGEVALVTQIVQDERELGNLQDQVDAAREANDQAGYASAVNDYNSLLESSTARRWWLGGLLAFSLIDAYIDAHFVDFDYEFDHDRALPEGTPPSPTVKVRVGFGF